MTDSATGQNLQEVEGLWFPADLVILQAGTRIFRVFTTILKEKSPIFADMFAIPQPSDPDVEKIDGVPLVKMHDDPGELESFLKAIFDSEYLFYASSTIEFDTIIGVLRLAHKYDVSFLHRRALQHLSTYYCTSLEHYRQGVSESYTMGSTLDAHLKTIQISVEVGSLWLLPDAYYSLLGFGLEEMLNAKSWRCLGEYERSVSLRPFSHKIQSLPTSALISVLSMWKDNDLACSAWARCNQVRLATIQHYDWDDDEECDLLNALHSYIWCELEDSGMCGTCLAEAKAEHERKLETFWRELPSVFGLPNWSALEKMRDAALA
ncbi:hypothetical protein B0H16DRAFT_1840144 [Mycena metata]|uniref:BTB domain-containing protein n=1 Tax=Mycena metata TaxID=1033252 RepID=A0AAD7N9R9_9AGAR|nr:hypothetical protein B0H16DRAFT_1840144 [Mycena metata]